MIADYPWVLGLLLARVLESQAGLMKFETHAHALAAKGKEMRMEPLAFCNKRQGPAIQ